MKVRVGILGGLLAGLVFATLAIAAEDIWSKAINNDTNGVWKIQPDKPKPKGVKAAIPGDTALRVKATKGQNPWDLQATSAINGGTINKGDLVMLMLYARAEQPAEGGSSLSVRIQLSAAPYTSTMDFSTPISTEWKSYCAHRVASAEMPAKQSNVSIHLATADQIIDLGPVFVFNLGPGYDEKKLKGCDG